MARVEGVSDSSAGIVTRGVYGAARRRAGQVPDPLRIMALNSAVMFASGGFEIAMGRARSLDQGLKDLAGLNVSMLVGCVF